MFGGPSNLNITKLDTFETFLGTLIVKDDFKPTVVMYILLAMYISNVNSKSLYENIPNVHNNVMLHSQFCLMVSSIETRLHKSRSSRSELEFDLSNFV